MTNQRDDWGFGALLLKVALLLGLGCVSEETRAEEVCYNTYWVTDYYSNGQYIGSDRELRAESAIPSEEPARITPVH